ncbi:MAG: PDZ domain-containing protein [Deltaproteobacteria bacterium]|nr:MAG: PDZ domain-containing protein [Deltaproteobacteria bacterium]
MPRLSLLLLLAVGPALAAPPNPYQRATGLIDRLYFYPTLIHAGNLLHGAADELADDVDWLLVDKPDESTVVLRYGEEQVLGTVRVDEMDQLPDALSALEALVRDSGHPLDEDEDLRLSILDGATQALDRYSRVLSGDSLSRFDVRLKGTIVGIGCNLRIVDDVPEITGVTAGGPADRAGLEVGDLLRAIDGVSTTNMPLGEVTRRIRGERGTEVKLSLSRGGETVALAMNREEVVVPNVEHAVLDDGVGYIRIGHFSQRTVQNLQEALEALRLDGALDKGLVLDLRGNTGGSLRHAARSADQFLLDGLLVRTAGPDGKAVHNLQARMDAVDAGDEPDVPLILLTDERTASGSEILAGALVEHGRAALVGTRTYGKGTVQKLYPLGEGASLKLTVAEYVLENERRIAYNGLVADVVVGDIWLGERGALWRDGWSEQHEKVPFDQVLPAVREDEAWRGVDDGIDVARELARRAVLLAEGATRQSVVDALGVVAGEMRTHQEAHLEEALAARDIDWTVPADVPEDAALDAEVAVRVEPAGPDEVWVIAEVANHGAALGQVLVELNSMAFSGWDGLRVPIGRIESGATGIGRVRVDFRAGIFPREDDVDFRVRAAGYEAVGAGSGTLALSTSPTPDLAVHARFVAGEQPKVAVVLENRGREPVEGLEVYFRSPGDLDVELVDRAVRVDLPPRSSTPVDLRLSLGAEAPTDELPLLLIAENERYGDLFEETVDLTLDGQGLRLQHPAVRPRNPPLSAPVGPLQLAWDASDDSAVDHVVVYVNGEKTQWVPGQGPKVAFRTPVEILPGANRVVVLVTDDQGLWSRRQVVIRGESPGVADGSVTTD